jgi:hypothetical protein
VPRTHETAEASGSLARAASNSLWPGDVLISTNTIESFFSILKRGINGAYDHVGKQQLHRYLSEFDFRYNSRNATDGDRSLLAIRKVTGKRLKYRDSSRP